MSRSGYVDDEYDWSVTRWRGTVARAIKGKRGQAFLREMLAAFEAMSEKRLITADLIDPYDGSSCALGAIGKARGLDMENVDPDDIETVAGIFRISDAMAREIVFMNDEAGGRHQSPEDRYAWMRKWVEAEIRPNTHQ